MSDDITEFTELDPEELHLVDVPATGFAALLAKSTKKGKNMKKNAKKIAKALKKAGADPAVADHIARQLRHRGVDLSGGASTVGRQGRQVLAQFESDVSTAKAALAVAPSTPMEQMKAKAALRAAQSKLLLVKSIIQENARQRGQLPKDRIGLPGLVPLIKEGSSHTIGEDTSLEYR